MPGSVSTLTPWGALGRVMIHILKLILRLLLVSQPLDDSDERKLILGEGTKMRIKWNSLGLIWFQDGAVVWREPSGCPTYKCYSVKVYKLNMNAEMSTLLVLEWFDERRWNGHCKCCERPTWLSDECWRVGSKQESWMRRGGWRIFLNVEKRHKWGN